MRHERELEVMASKFNLYCSPSTDSHGNIMGGRPRKEQVDLYHTVVDFLLPYIRIKEQKQEKPEDARSLLIEEYKDLTKKMPMNHEELNGQR